MFFEDSLSAITEYLKAAPETIKLVRLLDHKAEKLWAKVLIDFPGLGHLKTTNVQGVSKKNISVEIENTSCGWGQFYKTNPTLANDCILILDQISDPRNLGAVIRSAAFFGCRAVVIGQDRQSPLTQAAVSTSCGGLAYVKVVSAVNIKHAILDLKRDGYWIYGTDVEGGSSLKAEIFSNKSAILLGSEGKGMRPTVKSQCDILINIKGVCRGVESLNVATAAGVLSYHWFSNLPSP